MIKQYYTTLIIWFSLLVNELHTLWEGSAAKSNWIWKANVVMPDQWNVKYATDELWFILMALAILFYKPNRINKASVLAFLFFCVADMFMYFYNYKQAGYEAIYTFLLIAWITIYNYNGKRIRTTDRQGTIAQIKWGD
jgi:hypothetical protein